uniref:Uncharacterized protein n=1 Tax=Lactuca sativa TaxID=4236 RepID=A0A9R1XDV4_LACSA|nr:hypothetical protein LSAT_V11C500276160 [Lactuca sativa]
MVLSIWCFREKFATVQDLGKRYEGYDKYFTLKIQNSEVYYLEDMVSDDSREALYSESGYGSEGSGDDYDDSDYNVDESNIQFDIDVDMTEFHNVVDTDEHEILNNHSTDEGNDMIDNELENYCY